MTAVVSFYDIVLAGHILANVVAYGVLFSWPWLPGGGSAVHVARGRLLSRQVTYAAIVALVAGAYLATDRHFWGEPWVIVPLSIFVVLLGLIGSAMTPAERRMSLSAPDGRAPDAELYAREKARATRGATVCCALVVVAVFFMTAKPFA